MELPAEKTPDLPVDAGQPVPEAGLLRRQGMRLQVRLQPIVQIAGAIAGKVRLQAILGGAAGLWLWGVLFYPFAAFGRVWMLALGVGTLVLLLLPAGVLLLFWAGLRELIGVPDRLLEAAAQGETHTDVLLETVSNKAEHGAVRRLWRFFRTVLDLRALLLESKGLLLQFALVARIANPVFIGALFVAFVLSLLLIFAAALSVLLVVL